MQIDSGGTGGPPSAVEKEHKTADGQKAADASAEEKKIETPTSAKGGASDLPGPKKKDQATMVEPPKSKPPMDELPMVETPEEPPVVVTSEKLVVRLIQQGDPAGAARLIDELQASGETSPGLGGLRSLALLNSGDSEGALEAAVEALHRDPDNELAGQVRAYVESGGKVKGARLQLKAPDFGAGVSWAAGGAEPAGGEWMWAKEARAPAGRDHAGKVKPEGASDALVRVSMQKFRVGDLNGALLDATRALQADKSDLRSRAIRAAVSNRQKNYEGAVWEAGEILKVEPKNVPALLERGFAQYNLVQYGAALQDMDEAIRIDPSNALARMYRGMILEKMGRAAEAFAEYAKAAQLDPSTVRFLEEARTRGAAAPAGSAFDWKRLAMWGGPIALALGLIIGGLMLRPGVPERSGTTGAAAAGAASTAPTVAQGGAPGERVEFAPGTVGPGTLLGGTYRVERELGKGGMGVVYEAMDVKLQRPVALKHLKREAYDSPEMRERFLKEARLVAKLRHPHLAEIFAVVGEEDLYLVFELVQGEGLDKVISRRGRLTLEEAKRVVGEVCGALEYAHQERVIHRDLKPSNVMFDKDGKAKVMDFGIAHEARGSSTLTQTAAWGTPPYMAPEAEGGRVGVESDLYALAVMTYEMLTGARPFPGPYFLEKKLKKEYPPATAVNGALPKSVDAFFAKALEPEPERRHRSAAEFAAAFRGLS
ncbi:MAG: protein kinase [Elusimicrobia bacterium]|nr:protein kinase [Elusimicrobiota bacterium]